MGFGYYLYLEGVALGIFVFGFWIKAQTPHLKSNPIFCWGGGEGELDVSRFGVLA